jgi:MFS family permease
MVASALLISTPLYVFFGWLSDKIGRRPIVLAACVLAAATYFPLFKGLTAAANPALAAAMESAPVTVKADRRQCSLQFDPIGKRTFTSSCDIALQYLARAGVTYEVVDGPAGSDAVLYVGSASLTSFDGGNLPTAIFKEQRASWEKQASQLVAAAGYPLAADRDKINFPVVMAILVLMMSFAAMIYGPIAATLTELFPAKVRYTSMSLPYHLGTGWIGGFMPPVAFAMVAATGDIYSGLWYPLGFAVLTFVVGFFFLPETKGKDLRE